MSAAFQPAQGERYRRRADSRGDRAVLVAPRRRLAGHLHGSSFHHLYAIEDLADWLDGQAKSTDGQWALRLRWRAAVLRRLAAKTIPSAKPAHPPTVAFTKFCMDWFTANEPRVVASVNSLRTTANTWLYFTSPSGLIYKADHGRVDLYVSQHGYEGTPEELESAVAAGWGPGGYVAAVDTMGNPVLRYEHPDAISHSQHGVPDDTSGLEAALAAAATAARWLADQPVGGDVDTTEVEES